MELSGKHQKELAKIAGVSAPTFNEWVNAKKFPRIGKIQALADYFGIKKSELIEDEPTEGQRASARGGEVNSREIMAHNIRRYMDSKGVTNQKLCDDLGFKYTTFMDWIKGVTYPRISKIEAMADYFGIQKADLIEEKPPKEPETGMDTLANIIVRLCKDAEFRQAVENLYDLDAEKLRHQNQQVKNHGRSSK